MGAKALILGGARSGKSAMGERLASAIAAKRGVKKVYVATAQRAWAGRVDPEFAARIDIHRADRGPDWTTVEAPEEMPAALLSEIDPSQVVLVDCLTLWLSNRMMAVPDDGATYDGTSDTDALLEALAARAAPTLLVSNEVGHGLIPDTPLGRRFRDAQGRLNQRVAAAADLAVLTVAGLPMVLKGDLERWGTGGDQL
ncbi:MAG: bifunctional adenosylcobinamide kinase/adenosylcobinamide-phosphate guanylyltransferase [Pseudomonadota bacterium]